MTEAAPTLRRAAPSARWLAPDVMVVDNLLDELVQARVLAFLRNGAWQFGWKSNSKVDTFSFWHLHFAGYRKTKEREPYECAGELADIPLLRWFWQMLSATDAFRGHSLIRCYANGQSYGTDGTLHADSRKDTSYTAVYYPHSAWDPNWAGETVIFAPDRSDVMATIYPRPNRLAIFKGKLPHVARGVSRTCPELRITLMFKSDVLADKEAPHEPTKRPDQPRQSE